jgi:hypothetical protein
MQHKWTKIKERDRDLFRLRTLMVTISEPATFKARKASLHLQWAINFLSAHSKMFFRLKKPTNNDCWSNFGIFCELHSV